MNKQDKLVYLQQEHWSEWYDTRKEADQFVSDQHPMWCVCKRLCTGMHERSCSRFRAKVDSETIKRLKHLLPSKEEFAAWKEEQAKQYDAT